MRIALGSLSTYAQKSTAPRTRLNVFEVPTNVKSEKKPPSFEDGFFAVSAVSDENSFVTYCASATRLPRKPTPYLSTGIPASSISAA